MKNTLTLFLFIFALAIGAMAQAPNGTARTDPPKVPAAGAATDAAPKAAACVEAPTLMGIFQEGDTLAVAKSCVTVAATDKVAATHRIFKEIWGSKDNKIQMLRIVEGKVVPAKVEWTETKP